MRPIAEALKPRSWPRMGTRNECTSQLDESSQLTSSRRVNPGSRSRFQEFGRRSDAARRRAARPARSAPRRGWRAAARRARRRRAGSRRGRSACRRSPARRRWRAPARGRARRRSASARSARCAMRPAERWIAIRPKFAPAPVSRAATQRTMNWPAGSQVATTAQMPPPTVERDRDADRHVVAVAIGEAPGGERERDRRRREQAEQHAHRPRRVAFAQRRQRRRHADAGHARVQRDLAADQGEQRAASSTLSASRRRRPQPSVGSSNSPPSAAAPARVRRSRPRRRAARAPSRACASRLRRSCCVGLVCSFLRVLASDVAELAELGLHGASVSHTSDVRFSSASVRKPICRLVSVASSVVGPGEHDACGRAAALSTRPGRRSASA